MKITGYRVENYVMQMDRAIADANNPVGDDLMPASLLWIETDEGISGIAPGGGDIEQFFHLLEGEDPREVVGLWRRMVDYVHKGGLVASGGPIAAIDIALWDLKAKIAQEPLWQTFGALEGRTKAYASGIGYCLSDDELFAFYRRMAERGVDGGKLKIGLDMAADLRRIGDRAIGPEQNGKVEIAARRGPAAAVPAPARRLLAGPDHRQVGCAFRRQCLGILAGAADAVLHDQTAARRHVRAFGHAPNNTAAAASVPFRTGARPMKKKTVIRPVTVTITEISRPSGRSKASAGSSKYISLTMRR